MQRYCAGNIQEDEVPVGERQRENTLDHRDTEKQVRISPNLLALI